MVCFYLNFNLGRFILLLKLVLVWFLACFFISFQLVFQSKYRSKIVTFLIKVVVTLENKDMESNRLNEYQSYHLINWKWCLCIYMLINFIYLLILIELYYVIQFCWIIANFLHKKIPNKKKMLESWVQSL